MEPVRYTVYFHPVGVDIFSDSATWSNIRVYNRGLTLEDARDYCNINNPDACPGWRFSYCADQTANDFFTKSVLIL